MRNIKFIIPTAVVLILTVLVVFSIRNDFVECKQKILSDSGFIFKEAMLDDYNKRLKKVRFLYYYNNTLSHDWPKEKIVVETEKGERVQTNIDSIRSLPMEEKIRLIGETHLLDNSPINPDSLNACFQEVLHKRNISLLTGVRYTEVDNVKTLYSGADTVFFVSAYPLKEYKTGIFNEIVVRAYVKIPFSAVAEKAGIRLSLSVFAWLGILGIYIIYVYKVRRRKRAEVKPEDNLSEGDRIRRLMRLDTGKCSLFYNDREIELTPALVQLMSLFLNHPDCFLTKEEIANELWKNLDDHSNRLSQIMNRLRTTLSVIPGLEIETVRGVGYRMVLR